MYKVYSILERRILAVPETPREYSILGWQRYHPRTPKRALIRSFMRCATNLCLDRAFYKVVSDPFENEDLFAFQEWLKKVEVDLGLRVALPVIMWPPQKDRGRVYVHLFDEEGHPLGFAKISFDNHNAELLRNELRVLNLLSERVGQTCHIPTVVAEGRYAGFQYLILEPLPIDYMSISIALESYPEKCVEEIGGIVRVAEFREIEASPWWLRFSEMAKKSEQRHAFRNELCSMIISLGGLPVCQVHGDLRPANLVSSRDQLWIFDWEFSSDAGPVLTDKIGFDLAVHARKISLRPDVVLKSFNARYMNTSSTEKKRDVLAALAFRLTFEENITDLYIRNWAYRNSK